MRTDRLARNDRSKVAAEHDGEPWSSEETEFLIEFFNEAKGDADAECEVAEALGRTIEACRQRFYLTLKGRCRTVTVKHEVSTTTVEYRGHLDDPDDQWWSPDYYK